MTVPGFLVCPPATWPGSNSRARTRSAPLQQGHRPDMAPPRQPQSVTGPDRWLAFSPACHRRRRANESCRRAHVLEWVSICFHVLMQTCCCTYLHRPIFVVAYGVCTRREPGRALLQDIAKRFDFDKVTGQEADHLGLQLVRKNFSGHFRRITIVYSKMKEGSERFCGRLHHVQSRLHLSPRAGRDDSNRQPLIPRVFVTNLVWCCVETAQPAGRWILMPLN